MADNPKFFSTPIMTTAADLATTAMTGNVSAPTGAGVVTIFTGSTSLGVDTKINSIDVQQIATANTVSVARWCYLWIKTGSTFHLFDQFQITAITPSASVAPFNFHKKYSDLILPGAATAWELATSCTTVQPFVHRWLVQGATP